MDHEKAPDRLAKIEADVAALGEQIAALGEKIDELVRGANSPWPASRGFRGLRLKVED